MRGKGFRETCLQICSSDGTAVLPHKSPLVRRSPLFRLTSFLANVLSRERELRLIVFCATLACQLPERPDRRLLVSQLAAAVCFLFAEQSESDICVPPASRTCSPLGAESRGASACVAQGLTCKAGSLCRAVKTDSQLRLITWLVWDMKGKRVMKKEDIPKCCSCGSGGSGGGGGSKSSVHEILK